MLEEVKFEKEMMEGVKIKGVRLREDVSGWFFCKQTSSSQMTLEDKVVTSTTSTSSSMMMTSEKKRSHPSHEPKFQAKKRNPLAPLGDWSSNNGDEEMILDINQYPPPSMLDTNTCARLIISLAESISSGKMSSAVLSKTTTTTATSSDSRTHNDQYNKRKSMNDSIKNKCAAASTSYFLLLDEYFNVVHGKGRHLSPIVGASFLDAFLDPGEREGLLKLAEEFRWVDSFTRGKTSFNYSENDSYRCKWEDSNMLVNEDFISCNLEHGIKLLLSRCFCSNNGGGNSNNDSCLSGEEENIQPASGKTPNYTLMKKQVYSNFEVEVPSSGSFNPDEEESFSVTIRMFREQQRHVSDHPFPFTFLIQLTPHFEEEDTSPQPPVNKEANSLSTPEPVPVTVSISHDQLESSSSALHLICKGADKNCGHKFCCQDHLFKSWLLDQVEQSIIFTDVHGIVLFWNTFAERLFGYSKEEVMGKDIQKTLSFNMSAKIGAEIMHRVKQGLSWTGTFIAKRKDGKDISIRVTDSPMANDNGEIVGIVGVSMDNSKYEEAMERLFVLSNKLEEEVARRTKELQEAVGFLRLEVQQRKRVQEELELTSLVIRKTNTAALILDRNLQIEWINESFQRAMNFEGNEELVGSQLIRVLQSRTIADSSTTSSDPNGRESERKRQLLETQDASLQKIEKLLTECQPINIDLAFQLPTRKKKDGEFPMHWFNFDATPIFNEAATEDNNNTSINKKQPKLSHYLILLHDVNKQKMIEKEYVKANQLKNEFISTMSHEFRTPLNGIMGAASQILHELEKNHKVVPGGGDKANTDLISPSPSKCGQRAFNEMFETVSIIMSSSQLLLTLVNNVLDFQKIEAGKMEVRNTRFHFPSFLVKITRCCHHVSISKGVKLIVFINDNLISFDHREESKDDYSGNKNGGNNGNKDGGDGMMVCVSYLSCPESDNLGTRLKVRKLSPRTSEEYPPANIPEYVYGDCEKLAQILLNLVSNAIKYSPAQGFIKLHIRTTTTSNNKGDNHKLTSSNTPASSSTGGGGFMSFTISDQGPGVPECDKGKLFQRFSQLSGGTEEYQSRTCGSGLGLSICRNILERVGGDIWCHEYHSSPINTSSISNGNSNGGKANDEVVESRVLLRQQLESLERAESQSEWIKTLSALEVQGHHHDAAAQYHSSRVEFGGAIFHFFLPLEDETTLQNNKKHESNNIDNNNEDNDETTNNEQSISSSDTKTTQARTLQDLNLTAQERGSIPRILIVEDNLINQKVLTKILSNILSAGQGALEITVVANGQLAVKAVKEQQYFPIIFMDIQMPVMNGFEATKQITEFYSTSNISNIPSTSSSTLSNSLLSSTTANSPSSLICDGERRKRPLILALTANALKSDVEATRDAGFDYHLSKPITVSKIKSVLSTLGLNIPA